MRKLLQDQVTSIGPRWATTHQIEFDAKGIPNLVPKTGNQKARAARRRRRNAAARASRRINRRQAND